MRFRNPQSAIRMVSGLCMLLVCLCSLPSCAAKPGEPVQVKQYDHTIRVACVGDSITYGLGIEDREHHCYPAQLAALLGEKWEVRNFGVSGATMLREPKYVYCSSYWKSDAYQDALKYNPDVVVLKLGTNDAWRNDNWQLKAQFAADYRAMLDAFAALPSKPRIWLCTPASAYEERPELAPNLQEACDIIRAIAKERKLPVIDIHAATANHPEWFPDKCHPNLQGATVIAHEVYTALTGKKAPKAEPAPAAK